VGWAPASSLRSFTATGLGQCSCGIPFRPALPGRVAPVSGFTILSRRSTCERGQRDSEGIRALCHHVDHNATVNRHASFSVMQSDTAPRALIIAPRLTIGV
jgi:hypothetical protein